VTFTENELGHLTDALDLAIKEQRQFEREKLHFTRDSGVILIWTGLREKIIEKSKSQSAAAQAPRQADAQSGA
jgi:hypothetical protein